MNTSHLPEIMSGALAIFLGLVSVIYKSMDRRITKGESSNERLLQIAIETRTDVKHIREHCPMCTLAKSDLSLEARNAEAKGD